MQNKSRESFFVELSKGLLSAVNTNEIDNVVDFFLEKTCQFYNFDLGEVYSAKNDSLILRGVYGIDRYYVCKIEFYIKNTCYEDTLDNINTLITNNTNYSNEDIFNHYKSMIILPIFFHNRAIGVVVFRTKEEKFEYFNSILEELKETVGHFSICVNNVLRASIYEDRNKQLTLFRKLESKLIDNNNFEENLKDLAKDIAHIFKAKKAFIKINSKENREFIIKYGFDDNFDHSIFENKEYKKYFSTSQITYINDITKKEESKYFTNIISKSVLFSKLSRKINTISYIIIIDKISDANNPLGYFSDNDLELFNTILSTTSSRIYEYYSIIELKKANEINSKNMSRLNTLYDISNILLERSKTEDILFLLLTVTTIGEAFAFNRAFAFLYDEEFNVFRGRMCVAPRDGSDANEIWNNMKALDKCSLREKLMISLSKSNLEESWTLNQTFLNTVIPNSKYCKLFFNVFTKKESINIKDVHNNEKVKQLQNYITIIGDYPFAIIPIMNATKCIGMIVVDNPYNNMPIPDNDLEYLKMFGRQAAVALEYSALYNKIDKNNNELNRAKKRLLDLQSLAIIGEMSASITHNLRNFIVPIAGFANRLIKVSKDDNVKNYANIIYNEVEKLENYIKKNLSFAKSINLTIVEIDIDELIKYLTLIAYEYIKKNAKDIRFFAFKNTKESKVYWDYERINEVIMNLIVNAIDAIEMSNTKYESAIISLIFDDNDYKDSIIDITVENTHSYIKEDVLKQIFTPFFTTKSHGVGIGLATSKRIVEAHNGSIDIKTSNKYFEVTNFIISIPVSLNN